MGFIVSFPSSLEMIVFLILCCFEVVLANFILLHLLILLCVGQKDEECVVGTDLCCQVDSFTKVRSFHLQSTTSQ